MPERRIDPAPVSLADIDREQREAPWEITVRRSSRWFWWVTISKGMTGYGEFGGFHVFGSEDRAWRKAERRRERLALSEQRWNDAHQRQYPA